MFHVAHLGYEGREFSDFISVDSFIHHPKQYLFCAHYVQNTVGVSGYVLVCVMNVAFALLKPQPHSFSSVGVRLNVTNQQGL